MQRDFGYFEEEHLGKISDLSLWVRLLKYMVPYWRTGATAILLSMLVIGASLTIPYLVRIAIDRCIINFEVSTTLRLTALLFISFGFFFVVLVGFLANYFQVTLLEWTGQNFMHDIRQQLFRRLLAQDLAFFNSNPSGKLVTRLTNDIQNLHEMFTSVVITLFNDFLQLGGIFIILFFLNTKLALLMTIFLPFIIFISYFFSVMARGAFREIRTGIAKINSFLHESVTGLILIQICGRTQYTRKHFFRQNLDYFNKTLYQIKIFGVFMPLIEVLGTLSISLIILYGGSLVLSGSMTVGVFTAFLFYMRLFFKPVRELSQKYSIVQSAMASSERIFELLDRKTTILSAEQPHIPSTCIGHIHFQQVSFGYEKEKEILHDLTLTVRPGETLALVGATGSGKSTVINLLERLYDPNRGSIFLDQKDLKNVDTTWLRNQIGLVMQDIIILPATVKENISFGRVIKEIEFNKAIATAQLDSVISKLPKGMGTILGEGGYELSAGQKQLLALARILVRDPQILVLDEATSNIDSATEILIEEAVKLSIKGRTSIIIAHRLSTIRNADRIVVLDKGKIVEEGDHFSLVKQKGHYHHLLTLQNNIREITLD